MHAILKQIGLVLLLSGCIVTDPPSGIEAERRALALVDQGTVWLRRGQLDRAAAAFQVAYELTGSPAAIDGLGCVAFLKGEAQKAEQLFVQAFQMDDRYSQSLANLALLYESRGQHAEAGRVYRLAIREDPSNFRARNNFAGYLFDSKKGSRNEAHEQLLRAAALQAHPLLERNISKVEEP